MTKVIILENLPEEFEPNACGCEDDCPFGFWNQDLETGCATRLYGLSCPLAEEYDKRVEKYKQKIINIVEGK